MPRQALPETRLADAALRLLATKPWSEISLASVAKAAKVPMKDLAFHAAAKPALIGLILRRFGDDVTQRYESDHGSTRDRLFDVTFVWFDVLARHKKSVRALYEGLRRDPLTLFAARGAIVAAAEWLMTLAETDKGPALALRAAGLAAILGRAIPVWLDDERDLTKTMARVDADLRRGEQILGGS